MLGIDITSIKRIQSLEQKWGDKFLLKFLSPKEIKLATKISTIAGFWAAKEAASKAIGTGITNQCLFSDIKIKKLPSGQPILKYRKKIRKKYKIKETHLSISHDNDFAISVVINL